MMNRGALIAALTKLPRRDPEVGPEDLAQIAEQIILAAAFGAFDEAPRSKYVGRKKAEEELRRYLNSAVRCARIC